MKYVKEPPKKISMRNNVIFILSPRVRDRDVGCLRNMEQDEMWGQGNR